MEAAQALQVLGEGFAMIFEDGDRLLQHLVLPANARVLDVGTGLGHFAITLALRDYQVLTGEPAADDSEYAQQNWRSRAQAVGVDQRIQYRPFNAEDLPFEDASFHAVFFCGVLHHIEEDVRRSVLLEAFRTVRPGGVIGFLEPNRECLQRAIERHPTHPDAADPTRYVDDLAVTQETLQGRLFDMTIFRRESA